MSKEIAVVCRSVYKGHSQASRHVLTLIKKYLGSSVSETEISDVATTSTLTSLSLKTLNTCTARSNCLQAHMQVAGLVQHMHALVYEPFTPDNSLIENGPPLTGNRTGPACALKLCPARSHLS